ncbi:MAG: hypothetical protein V4685_06495 [Bacteroidota bacterium]
MKKYKTPLLFLFSSILLYGCPINKQDFHQQVLLKSNAENLYMYKSYTPYLQDSTLPVSFSVNSVDLVSNKNFEVYNSFVIRKQLKEYISETPDKAIYFFLFNQNVIDSIPWDSIRAKKLYLRRYAIREIDVDNSSDFILYYP